jgi:hypothetical protein
MWADGGLRGLFRGNLATVTKVFPSSAISFAAYDACKDVLQAYSGPGEGLLPPLNVCSSACPGDVLGRSIVHKHCPASAVLASLELQFLIPRILRQCCIAWLQEPATSARSRSCLRG